MDWLIRVIQGPDQGVVQPLIPGPNIIGRGKAAAVKLSSEDVSWEHAAVILDKDQCFLENLSAQGTWVGDAKIAGRVRLRPGDKVRLNEQVILRVESASGGGVSRGVLIAALVVMLLLLGAVVYYQVLAAPEPTENWETAYNSLLPWVQQQVRQHKVPAESADLFRDAWRHSAASDWAGSQRAWLRLQIVLSSSPAGAHCMELAAGDPSYHMLKTMFAPPPGFEPTDDQNATALGDFVNFWLQRSINKQRSLNPLS